MILPPGNSLEKNNVTDSAAAATTATVNVDYVNTKQKIVNVWSDDQWQASDSRIYAACSDNSIYICNSTTGATERVLSGHEDNITVMEGFAMTDGVAGSEHLIDTGSNDKSVRVWDRRTARQPVQLLRGHTDTVTNLTFAENGRVIVSGSKDKTIRIWDVRAGRHRQSLERHYGSITQIQAIPDHI